MTPGPITVQQVAARVDDFLARHFPTHIDCRVRLYEDAGGGGVTKSHTLKVTLANQV